MNQRTIKNLNELRNEREFIKQGIQLKFSEVNNELLAIKTSVQQFFIVGAVQKVFGIFKK